MYRIIYTWAGVRGGRASNRIPEFGDANVEAIRLAGKYGEARVYAVRQGAPDRSVLVAWYERNEKTGGVVSHPVDPQ